MNNLKRVLSLALSGIMLVGMMAVGAGAVDYKDFTDKDEITHTEAVSTMTLLGVIAGKDTGAFDPKGTVTRAEMAKMITVSLNGGKDPILGTKSTPTYSDIKGHWAEKYIEYCASLDIIAGQGDGTFAPDATVTGTQAAKMMLTAMGYEAEVFNLVGSDWDINTNREANDANLYEDLDDMDPAQGMSRDNAAQLIWNGIQQNTMKKSPSKSVTSGEITWDYTLDDDPILLGRFKVYTSYGSLTDVDEGNLTIKIDGMYDKKATGHQTNFRKVATDYNTYLGYTVKVLYRAVDDVVGVAPVDDNVVYTTAQSGLEKKGDSNEKIKFDGSTYSLERRTDTYSTGWTTPANTSDSIDLLTVTHAGDVISGNTNAASLESVSSYNTVTFIDNDNDGVLEYAVVREMVPGKVTFSNNSQIIVAGKTFDRDDNVVPEDTEKGDYVVTSYNPFDDNYVVEALEKGNGDASVNADFIAGTGKPKVMFEGKWYAKSSASMTDAVVAGNTYDYYTFNGVLVDTVIDNSKTTLNNVVMLLKKNAGITNQARVLFSDGSKKTVEVVNGTGVADTDYVTYTTLAAGTLYTYTEKSGGYVFKAIANTQKIGGYTFASAGAVTTGTTGDVNGVSYTDDAIVYVYGGTTLNDGKILTGKQLKNLTVGTGADKVLSASKGYFTSKTNGLTRATVVAVALDNATATLPAGTVTGSKYALITSNAFNVDGDYAQYTIWNGEENLTVKEKGAYASLGNRQRYDVVTYESITSDGVIESVDLLDLVKTESYAAGKLVAGAVYSISSDTTKMWYTNGSKLDITGSTVFMAYDSSSSTTNEIGKPAIDLVQADTAVGNIRVPNVKFVGDGSGDLAFVLIDVKNRIQDAKTAGLYHFTTSAVTGLASNVVGSFNGTSGKIVYGQTLTLTIDATADTVAATGQPSKTLTLTGGVFAANNSNTITLPPVAKGEKATFSVIATGNVSCAAS